MSNSGFKQTYNKLFMNYGIKFQSYIWIHRAFKLCSNFERFHQGIDKLKTIFENNGYPKSFVDFCIKKYLDKVFIKKKVVLKASKKELICVLPFPGKKSLQLRTRLLNSIENNLKFCKVKVIFQSPCKLNSLFLIKIPFRKRSPLTLFTDARVVTARLLIMVKYTATFLLELQSTWIFLI